MPFIQVDILEGRTLEQIENLIVELTQATHRSLGAPVESIRVKVNEVPTTHWGIAGQTAKARGR